MQTSPDPNKPRKSRPPVPETVGATSAPFHLGKQPTSVSFEIHPPSGPAREGHAKRVLLRVENVKSAMQAPPFDVYLNLPPTEEPEKRADLHAFTMSTFGLIESSKTRDHHPGNGLNFVEDVTDLVTRLAASGTWDRKILHITFIPGRWKYPIDVTVGRVSLMLE